jgi:hypothetical protein
LLVIVNVADRAAACKRPGDQIRGQFGTGSRNSMHCSLNANEREQSRAEQRALTWKQEEQSKRAESDMSWAPRHLDLSQCVMWHAQGLRLTQTSGNRMGGGRPIFDGYLTLYRRSRRLSAQPNRRGWGVVPDVSLPNQSRHRAQLPSPTSYFVRAWGKLPVTSPTTLRSVLRARRRGGRRWPQNISTPVSYRSELVLPPRPVPHFIEGAGGGVGY